MYSSKIGLYCWIIFVCVLPGLYGWTDNKQRSFKDGFLFGSASSAYQVEGAWNADGKGESIWDRFLHEHPEVVVDGRNGDVASDSYHLYRRDVDMLRHLGVDFYRFSISWPRVLPTGLPSDINEKGFMYYDNLINELLKYKIEPMITLYHFDLPQSLQDLGGWVNPLSVEWFEDYARTVFDRYASKVKYWITINQPDFCMDSYGSGLMAPGVKLRGIADYLCVKNVLLAHAKVYELYKKDYKPKYKGSVGISISVNWVDPVNNRTENVKAAEEVRQFLYGMYIHPIWSKHGDFPEIVKEIVARNSKKEGHPTSRLPKLSSEEIRLIRGSADFLGMNHYTTFLVKQIGEQVESSLVPELKAELSYGKDWRPSRSPWLKSAPYGLYKACLYVNKHYDYPPVIITENGWSTESGLSDTTRVEHLKGYLSALLLAIEDGTDVRGYTAWSLMDNLEWTAGTSERFGLYEVDFDSEDKKRTARQSALFYKHVIDSRVVEEGWKPEDVNVNKSKKGKKKAKVEL